jgi:putative ATP-binding cassette transporter
MAAVDSADPMSRWTTVRRTAASAWALTRPYFVSEQRWVACGLLAAVVALNLAFVYLAVLFNQWNQVFYDSLQEKNSVVFWEQLWRFCYLAFIYIVIAVYKFYLSQLLEIRWRAWLTQQFLTRWLSDQAFYVMELARFGPAQGAQADNPDQRIQEDIGQFTAMTLGLAMGLLHAVVTLASFVGILWALSGDFGFSLGGSDYSIPGFMVWMALLYCGVGSVLTHYIGRSQIALNFQQQRLEADFRHHLIRVREYSESIALDGGAHNENQRLRGRFDDVLGNFMRLLRAQKNLVWFTSFFGQAAVVFPFVVAAPRFFSGAIKLGDLMQISSAFGQVQGAMSWFVDSYSSLATWRATTDRLTGFSSSLASIARGARAGGVAPLSVAGAGADSGVQADAVRVCLPDGSLMLAADGLRALAGERVLLQGPSGSGKSSLFRTLAGIWPFASGTVQRSPDAMFIPQRPYFPNGALREALAYPELSTRYSDAQLQQALTDAQLPALVGDLDRQAAWGQTLSGGEQQRLAIARVLLKRPAWVFADEATSALDDAAQAAVYAQLVAMTTERGGGMVSIAHRDGLAAFHTRVWVLVPAADGVGFTLRDHDRL